MKQLARRVALALCVLLLVLAGGEGAARVMWSRQELALNPLLPVLRDHATRLWEYTPNADLSCPPDPFGDGDSAPCPAVHTNSHGLRSPETTWAKPAGTVRLLSLGESTTAGSFVAMDQTYTALLGGLLGVEAINAGVEAWTTWQSAVYLAEEGYRYQPDLVLIYHQGNDAMPTGVTDGRSFMMQASGADRELYERRRLIAPVLTLLYRSHLYLAGRRAVLGLSATPEPGRKLLPGPGAGSRVPDADRRLALEWLLATCQGIGADLVVLQPTYDGGPGQAGAPLLQDFAREHGLLYVDLPAARNRAGLGRDFFVDGVHPTVEGHRRLAAWIARDIRRAGLIEP